MDERDEIRRRRERWMEEREVDINREGTDALNTSEIDPTEIFSKIALKINNRIKEKYKGSGVQSGQNNDDMGGSSLEEEELCLKTHQKQLQKCPFCRKPIKSKALNISLQTLIRSAQEKKDVVTKPLTIKEGLKRKDEMHIPDSEKFDEDMVEIRLSILQQEQDDINLKSNQISAKIKEKTKVVNQLKAEEREILDRLEKVKKELELVREFIDNNEEEIEKLRVEKRKKEKESALIDDTIQPLKVQIDKYKLMRFKY